MMIKYLVLISVVLFSQIKGEVIIHTETHKNGGIKLISYHKMVDGGMGISLLKEETYHFDGRKIFERNYENGEKHGKVINWGEDGKKGYEGKYKNGKEDGLWTGWYENGKKKWEETYKDGKYDGLIIKWYKNGKKKEEKNYKDGKRDGLFTHWYENGRKEYEGTYEDDELISEKYWNEDGSVKE